MLPVLFLSLIAFALSAPTQTACNGHPELCNRIYSNVSQVGAHDSAFVGPLPQDNQNVDVTAQLNRGIRFLQGQTHVDGFGTLSLCHTTCLELDAGPLKNYLSAIKTWLDKNPNEVVTLLLTNAGADISKFDAAFTGSELKNYAFIPASRPLPINAWPTLHGLISSGKRLVTFLGTYVPFPPSDSIVTDMTTIDSGADFTRVPYILDEFTYFFETPFDTTDPAFAQCTLDRPANSKPDGKMYIVNHFLDLELGKFGGFELLNTGILVPDRKNAARTNAATGTGSIGAQAALCKGKYGRKPNFVLVDFVDQGQVIIAQDALNGF
jgi:hypothetical protein